MEKDRFDYREADPGRDEAKKIAPPAPVENASINIEILQNTNDPSTKEDKE